MPQDNDIIKDATIDIVELSKKYASAPTNKNTVINIVINIIKSFFMISNLLLDKI